MPGSVQNAAPATVMPQSLWRAFAHERAYPTNNYGCGCASGPIRPARLTSSRSIRPAAAPAATGARWFQAPRYIRTSCGRGLSVPLCRRACILGSLSGVLGIGFCRCNYAHTTHIVKSFMTPCPAIKAAFIPKKPNDSWPESNHPGAVSFTVAAKYLYTWLPPDRPSLRCPRWFA